MNHGGYSEDDTHIACLIAVNGGTQVTVNETVSHTQARPPSLIARASPSMQSTTNIRVD